MKLVSVSEMQQVEQQADAAGLSYASMMENAGVNLGQTVLDIYGSIEEKSALGLVGSGNNGGDTLVSLAFLASKGWRTWAYIVRPRPVGEPLVIRLLNVGGSVIRVEQDSPSDGYPLLKQSIRENSILLDGVLGTRARLPLKPEIGVILDAARSFIADLASPPIVVAVDCPSGVDCDTGECAPEAIPASCTVTMAAIKKGLLSFPAYQLVGDLRLVGIGSLDNLNLPAWENVKNRVVSLEWVAQAIPKRPLSAHKGTFGAAVIVAGSLNYTGAVLLAGEAAYRIGAGWVTLAVPAPLHAALAGQLPEATWILLPHEEGGIAQEAALVVKNNLERCTALLIGPGFGLRESTRQFIEDLITRYGNNLPPVVMDADGLKLLARIPDWPKLLPAHTILTPHPGEMRNLTGLTLEQIQSDRLGVVAQYARQWGHIVVLKGAFTVIASPQEETFTVPVATPALARAGTGDVLAGIIVGLRAQGMEAFQAAVAGAWIHAKAGLYAAEALGNSASVIAGDVLSAVKRVASELYTSIK